MKKYLPIRNKRWLYNGIGKTSQTSPAVREGGGDVPAEDIAAKDLVVLVIEQIAGV